MPAGRCVATRLSLLLLDPNHYAARPRSGGSTHSQNSQYSHSGSQAGQQYGQQRDMRGSWDKKSSTGSVGSARDSRDSRGSRGSNDGLRMSGGPGQPLHQQSQSRLLQMFTAWSLVRVLSDEKEVAVASAGVQRSQSALDG